METWLETATLIRLAADAAMATLIWLVQLIIYPAFGSIETSRFISWHHRYMRSISFVVIPLMMLQAGCIAVQVMLQPNLLHIASLLSAAAAWSVTFCVSVPCHNALQEKGNQPAIVERIVKTNWWRTASWTLTLILGWIHFAAQNG